MAGTGRQVRFHGAFAKAKDAKAKHKRVKGSFVRAKRFRGRGVRYMVLTRRGKTARRVRNPLLAEYLNPGGPSVVGTIPGTLEEIRYKRTGARAGPYKHAYRSSAKIHAMSDGSLWIRPKRRGQRLWGRYPES